MKKVKIGAVAWGLPGGGAYAPRVAHLAGLDGIQLELGSYEAGYPLAQREVMDGYLEDRERYGLEYPTLVLNDVMVNEFINGRNTEHGKVAYDQIALGIHVAAEMKINRIMIPNFLENLITEPAHVEHTIEALKYACKLAGQKQIDILTENALPFEEQETLIKQVGEVNLKVHFDTQNFKFNFDMDQLEQLKGLYPLMDSVLHTKDGLNNPGDRLLGTGNTKFFEQMVYLKEKGFEGFIITENYYNLMPLRKEAGYKSQMELLMRDVKLLRSCFEADLENEKEQIK